MNEEHSCECGNIHERGLRLLFHSSYNEKWRPTAGGLYTGAIKETLRAMPTLFTIRRTFKDSTWYEYRLG